MLPTVRARSEELLAAHQRVIWARTDKLFGKLLTFEWIACIAIALLRVPYIWDRQLHTFHPHIWMALLVGGSLATLPIALGWARPGEVITRHVIAASQLLMCALFIHVGDGRIEMHFHIFGSLAFLAFYRDWRVLITASVVVLADHLLRGIFLPQSIYGVLSPTIWRSFEHAGWVVFEDIFLITSCIQGVREMEGIAVNRALLEQSYADVEAQVIERTRQLKDVQADLVKVARSAGIAEAATAVLHNVGNVLNSVNVSANLVTERVRKSELPNLARVSQLFEDHRTDLSGYLAHDERGKLIPVFIKDLAVCLNEEHHDIERELSSLATGVEHIKQIVVAQQSFAKRMVINTPIDAAKLMDAALLMHGVASQNNVAIIRRYEKLEPLNLDQQKILQILLNLIGNAAHALRDGAQLHKQITLAVAVGVNAAGRFCRFQVIDNGIGIAPENMPKLFVHGFTTKPDGHGFGLHSSANTARELGGTLHAVSNGPELGATFTLEIPLTSALTEIPCSH